MKVMPWSPCCKHFTYGRTSKQLTCHYNILHLFVYSEDHMYVFIICVLIPGSTPRQLLLTVIKTSQSCTKWVLPCVQCVFICTRRQWPGGHININCYTCWLVHVTNHHVILRGVSMAKLTWYIKILQFSTVGCRHVLIPCVHVLITTARHSIRPYWQGSILNKSCAGFRSKRSRLCKWCD